MDISVEVAAIQAASQGSELRQPLVGALNKLNSGSLPAVTVSDVGKILKVGANGWEVGEKSGYMPVPTTTKQITENGTYDVTDYSSAQVYVSGGGGTLITKTITRNGTYNAIDDNADGYSAVDVDIIIPNENLIANWNFTNPYNSRGNTYYSGSGAVNCINGWIVQNARIDIVNGGINLSYINQNDGWFYHVWKKSIADVIAGKTVTLSALIDNNLNSSTFTFPATNVTGAYGYMSIDTVPIYVYRVSSNDVRLSFGGPVKDYSNRMLKAVKLELGSTQTLATLENGVWVLNENTSQQQEQINVIAFSNTN